jgi:hypothetical protein
MLRYRLAGGGDWSHDLSLNHWLPGRWLPVNFANCGELKIRHQSIKLPRHTLHARIGSKASDSPGSKLGLIGIDLPRMEINARRLLLFAVQPPDARRTVAVWQQTQICPAPNWHHTVARNPNRSCWDLLDEPRRRVDDVCVPLEARNPVTVVRDRVYAGIVGEPAFNQGFKRPKRLSRNGVAGSAINPRTHAASVFNRMHRAQRIAPESRRRQTVNKLVRIAVATNLVTCRHNCPYATGTALCHPTQDEKRGRYAILGKQFKNLKDLIFHSGRKRVPLFRTNRCLNLSWMEVLFNVNCESVQHFPVNLPLSCRPQLQTKHGYCVHFRKKSKYRRVGYILEQHAFVLSTFWATPLTIVLASPLA